jgi:protocatechuate 3,4-dioxygenase alpha subunit
MNNPEILHQTASQTVGPYFAYGLVPEQYRYDFDSLCDGNLILDEAIDGERITVFGRILDGNGQAIPDAMVEIWQADANGRYLADKTRFHGFGRYGTGTDKAYRFLFRTIKPGSVGNSAPHLNVILFMRGLLSHLYTRIYFDDESQANSIDPLLVTVEHDRLPTLVARRVILPNQSVGFEFNIHMQGDRETVFFDV